MKRLYARKKALSVTPGRTAALNDAVHACKRHLTPTATDSNLLCREIVAASQGEVDEDLARSFLIELHRQFKRYTLVSWEPSPPRAPAQPPQMQGREDDLKAILGFVDRGCNVVIRGAPGLGKTTLLQALHAKHPRAVFVRLEQGGNAMRDLRLGLHRSTGGDFPVDDDQGIALIGRAFSDGGLVLVDNADEQESAEAIQRLVSHVPALVVIVTSRGQSFPGFESYDLKPLNRQAAEAILVAEFDLSSEDHQAALARGKGNPQLIKQEADALQGGEVQQDDRLAAMLSRFDGDERRVLWLIGEFPLATLPISLMTDVGKMGHSELDVLRRNAVATPSGDGYELHETLRGACRELLATVPQAERRGLVEQAASFYLKWLEDGPELAAIDDALANLMHLLECLQDPELKVDLALALIGDRLDDPFGYLPSRGLTGLFREKRLLLQQAASEIGGSKAAQLEKNLGLFCHWGDDPAAKELVLSARSRFQEAGDDEGRAAATWVLGIIADDSCRYADAEALYREPLSWLRDPQTRAVGQHLVGCSLYHQGRYDEARTAFEQARHATDDPVLLSRIARRLSYVELINGDAQRAIDGLEDTRQRAAELQRPRDVGRISRHIGEANLRLGKVDDAQPHLEAARAIFEKVGDRRGLGATLLGLATTRRLQGDFDAANDFARQSRDIAIGSDEDLTTPVVSPVGFARAVEEEGRILSEIAGQEDDAIKRLRRACNIYEVVDHARSEVLANELGSNRDAPIPLRPAGVLFDLADTLAETQPHAYEESKAQLAKSLKVDRGLFMEAWVRSRHRASTDSSWTTRDRIEWVARELAVDVDGDTLDELADAERELWASSVILKDGALDVLKRIRATGTKIALVSNGPSAMQDLPDTLGLTPVVSATVMSSVVGMLKPHPGIYHRALDDLDLAVERCIFVGDGSDRELEGAQAVGLFSIRMQFGPKPAYQTKHSLNWDATVHSLAELAERIGV